MFYAWLKSKARCDNVQRIVSEPWLHEASDMSTEQQETENRVFHDVSFIPD